MSAREVPVSVAGSIDRNVYDALAPVLRDQPTLGSVLAWGRAQSQALTVTEIITQDEFTHDVVVGIEAPHYLVFDTT